MAPFAPHIAEELWVKLGNEAGISYVAWPTFDESKLVESEVEIVVQINGKLKAKIKIAKDLGRDELEKIGREAVAEALEGKNVVKVIAVPNKLVNIVVK